MLRALKAFSDDLAERFEVSRRSKQLVAANGSIHNVKSNAVQCVTWSPWHRGNSSFLVLEIARLMPEKIPGPFS